MKTAERTGRFFLAAVAAAGAAFFLLPFMDIRADVVLSGSMEPVLKTGSVVFTDMSRTLPAEGDIITYRLGESYVTHRVVRREGRYFITRGDANDEEDLSPVSREQIVGRVLFSIPFLGYAAVFIRQKAVFSLLFLLLVQELVFMAIHQWKGERGENAQETK